MSVTQQSSFTVLTLAEWMTRHDDSLDQVVEALCQIFDLPDDDLVKTYLEMEIDRQARLLLIIEEQTILAIGGWNWAHLEPRQTELPVYLGVRRNLDIEGLRMVLVSSVMTRLKEDRIRADMAQVVQALLQYHPDDRILRDLCLSLGYKRDKRRNSSFQESLGAHGVLRTILAPITS